MKSKYLKSSFILSYIAIFIQSLISIVYTPVMLRLLGQSDYGLLQLAISTIANLGILSFGFGSSYLRFYSRYKADNDDSAIAALNGMFTIIFTAAALLSLIAGGFITLNAGMIFSQSMSAQEISSLKVLLGIMTVNLAFSFQCNIFDSYVISHERFIFQKMLIIIAALLNPMLTMPLLIIGKGSVAVAICMTAITLIKLISGMVFCIKHLGMRFCFTFDKALFKQLFVFSFFIFLNIISDQINWNADKTLLGIFKGADSVTTYSLGSQFNNYYLTFSYALSSLLSPRAYRIASMKKGDKLLSKFFVQFGRIQLTVMAYILMIFIAIGKPFIKLWSGIDSDIPYYTALLLISPLLITSIQSIGIEIQRAKDMHRFRSILYVFIALGNILLSIPLCIKYGELGCAFGTGMCLVIGNIIIMNIYYQKRVGLDMIRFWREMLKFVPAFVIPVIFIVILHIVVQCDILSVIIGGAVFTLVYWLSIWFFGLTKAERKYIKRRKA